MVVGLSGFSSVKLRGIRATVSIKSLRLCCVNGAHNCGRFADRLGLNTSVLMSVKFCYRAPLRHGGCVAGWCRSVQNCTLFRAGYTG